jgi:hypothetical protein
VEFHAPRRKRAHPSDSGQRGGNSRATKRQETPASAEAVGSGKPAV